MGKTKYKLTIILVILSNIAVAQIDTGQVLIQKIYQECELIFLENFDICKKETSIDLKEKFKEAEIYLTDRLSKMVLVDSSAFYAREKKALEYLEKIKPKNKNDSLDWNNKRIKSYLLLSVLQPLKSDSLFTKLLHCYFQITAVKVVDNSKLESFFYYKIWLCNLLDNRFAKETIYYSKLRAILYYTRAIDLSQRPFIDIVTENILLTQLEKSVKESTVDNLIEKEYKDIMSHIYLIRASKGAKKHDKNKKDSLFQFLETVYLKAWKLTPESYTSNKYFGLFYYNEATSIIQSIPINATPQELKKFQHRASILFEKAQPLIKKTKQLSME